LEKRLRELVTCAGSLRPEVRWRVLGLESIHMERCLACSICPIPEQLTSSDAYACIIQTPRDGLKGVRAVLRSAQGILIAGMHSQEPIESCYQELTERTRVMRRNDFELTNVPIASFTWEKVGANSENLFGLKVLTSYVRHNAIVCPPLREISWNQTRLLDAFPKLLDFVDGVARLTRQRTKRKTKVSYKAEGYGDKRLDGTEAFR
jgi:hypothetical protein